MEYREELYAVVDKFFNEIVMPFGRTNAAGGELVKKVQLFGKKNYDEIIRRFEIHMEQTALLSMAEIAIPEDDADAQMLREYFNQSRKTFMRLCETNMDFYGLQNRKSHRQGATVKEFKKISLAVSLALNSARRDMNELENHYKKMKGMLTEDQE